MLTVVEVIMDFKSETKMKDIALSNPAARQVLEDAGLDYCCGGGKSLHEACLHANASPEEILKRLRENARETGPEDLNWMAAPLCELTRHIRDKHHRYVREAIPRTQARAFHQVNAVSLERLLIQRNVGVGVHLAAPQLPATYLRLRGIRQH